SLMHPLPDLRAGNLRSGGVLHQVVERHAPQAAEPGLKVLNAHADVVTQTFLGNRALWHFEELLRRDVDIIAPPVDLVRPFAKDLVKFLRRDLNQPWMSDPGAVVSGGGFAAL